MPTEIRSLQSITADVVALQLLLREAMRDGSGVQEAALTLSVNIIGQLTVLHEERDECRFALKTAVEALTSYRAVLTELLVLLGIKTSKQNQEADAALVAVHRAIAPRSR
jgi:hypothetical protein